MKRKEVTSQQEMSNKEREISNEGNADSLPVTR